MPVPVGAAVGAAASLASSFIGNAGTKRAAKFAAQSNKELWAIQNAYNHPLNQMSRLKSAGLNPNLIYGQNASGASGNAESIAPYKAAEYNMKNPMGEIAHYANLKQTEAQTDNTKEATKVAAQDTLLKAAQTGKTLAEGSSAKTKAKVDKELIQTTIDGQKEQLRKLEHETIGADLDNQFKSGALKDKLKQINYEAQAAKATLTGKHLDNDLKRLEKELNQLGISKSDPFYIRILGRGYEEGVKTLDKFDKEVKPKIKKFMNKFKR